MTKSRYSRATINITYKEGDTGDLVFHFSDMIDLSVRDLRMQVRDEDNNVIFSKDSGISVPTITIVPWYEEEEDSDFDIDASTNTLLGYMATVTMDVEDTKTHNSLTTVWEMEAYDSDEVNTLVGGKFVITAEIVNYDTP